jgi:hypothetical protein
VTTACRFCTTIFSTSSRSFGNDDLKTIRLRLQNGASLSASA